MRVGYETPKTDFSLTSPDKPQSYIVKFKVKMQR